MTLANVAQAGALFGVDLFGEPIKRKASGPLAERFTFPPFSVLDARSGEWRDRKRAWMSLGIRSELGRSADLIYSYAETVVERTHDLSDGSPLWLEARAALRDAVERARVKPSQLDGWCGTNGMAGHWLGNSQPSVPTPAMWRVLAGHLDLPAHLWTPMTETRERAGAETSRKIAEIGTSIFDPVLCELAYRWWSPEGGQVVDPFAGGSVRGVVAGMLGRSYWGCDLRAEQIAANEHQARDLCVNPAPVWVVGDALDELEHAPAADFVLSCPPYGDLERYSDDERDLSGMEHHTFVAAYKRIILRTVRAMKPDTFACFVVGDFRDKKGGYYRNFVSETIDGFEAAGARLYNDAILLTGIGTGAMRAGGAFASGRKLTKTHQNVLVFCKGDWRSAVSKLGDAA